MKKIFISCIVVCLMGMGSCQVPMNNNEINPPLDNESFTNYTPWWVTNSISTNITEGVTNGPITK